MDIKNYVKIQVMDMNGNWYDNAFIENEHDAVMVGKYYRDTLGYKVKLLKGDSDISFMLNAKTVQIINE